MDFSKKVDPLPGLLITTISVLAIVPVSLVGQATTPAPRSVPASASPITRPTVRPVPPRPVSPRPAIEQQLVGTWRTKESINGDTVVFGFFPDGRAFLMTNPAPNARFPQAIRYRVNTQTKPMQMDVILNAEKTVLTVFEFTKTGELRMQMLGTAPGQTRPTALGTDATVFQKVSSTPSPAAAP